MTDRLRVWAYVAGWALLRALPERLARWLFRVGADAAFRRRGKGVQRLRSNLRRVLGPDVTPAELDRVVRDGVRSYARYWLESFRLPVTPPETIVARVRMDNEQLLRDAYASGRGVVLVLPHMANWDHGGAWAVLTGMPFTTVAERLRPEALFDRFVAFRESLGMKVIPLTGGERPPSDVLVERLRAGGMLCLVGDRDLTARGIDVELFGATARFPAGPAALALRTGADLLPATLWYDGELLRIRMHEPVPHTRIREMTQGIADAFADGIRAHPQDWHMLQRLWLEDLDAGRAPSGAEAVA